MTNTPIAFIIFNRPKKTEKVLATIREAKPKKLFVIADGPRSEAEKALCASTREIIDRIDWPCEVIKNYSDVNLGCKKRIASGLDWVFTQTDRAIILEDDCVPDQSFFVFCEELLEYYKNDEKIMHISGNFFQQKNKKFTNQDSYYFSILPHIWGWATWKRAWDLYEVNITDWPTMRRQGLLKAWLNNSGAYEYWGKIWDQYHAGQIDSWDGQWFFACAKHQGLCINPTKNLVANIGFDQSATHSKIAQSEILPPTTALNFPLQHPTEIKINPQADNFTFRQNFGIDDKVHHRLLRPIKNMFPNAYWKVRNLFR